MSAKTKQTKQAPHRTLIAAENNRLRARRQYIPPSFHICQHTMPVHRCHLIFSQKQLASPARPTSIPSPTLHITRVAASGVYQLTTHSHRVALAHNIRPRAARRAIPAQTAARVLRGWDDNIVITVTTTIRQAQRVLQIHSLRMREARVRYPCRAHQPMLIHRVVGVDKELTYITRPGVFLHILRALVGVGLGDSNVGRASYSLLVA
jgi:hypothetical protein